MRHRCTRIRGNDGKLLGVTEQAVFEGEIDAPEVGKPVRVRDAGVVRGTFTDVAEIVAFDRGVIAVRTISGSTWMIEPLGTELQPAAERMERA